ncbi:MAG: hypothetical protein WBG08_01005 [Litorimonas sp.]
MSSQQALKDHIIGLSESDQFFDAKNEWVVGGFTLEDDWDECPCGKEIKELCHLINTRNGNRTYVGNVCVKKFIELDTGSLFAGLRRIIDDDNAAPNEDLIVHAQNAGYIYVNEYNFLMQTRRKRKLSPKQLAWRQKINRRIIQQTRVRR